MADDALIFNEIKDSDGDLDIAKNMFYCKKVFYVENTTEKTCVIKYGFVKNAFFNIESDSGLIKENLIKFLAMKGHAIFKRVKKIKLDFMTSDSDECQPIVKIYEIIYNQDDQIILIMKKSLTAKSSFEKLLYTYKIFRSNGKH